MQSAADDKAGKVKECPECGKSFRLPAPSDIQAPSDAPRANKPAARAPKPEGPPAKETSIPEGPPDDDVIDADFADPVEEDEDVPDVTAVEGDPRDWTRDAPRERRRRRRRTETYRTPIYLQGPPRRRMSTTAGVGLIQLCVGLGVLFLGGCGGLLVGHRGGIVLGTGGTITGVLLVGRGILNLLNRS
jgi:hypothetical protein